MSHYYSPHTGELIVTDTPAEWMRVADISPPSFDVNTQSCFWRGDRWEVEQAIYLGYTPVKPTAQPTYDPATERVEQGQPVRQQRRNEDGTFVADDPETLDDEAWEWVQTWNVVPLTPDEIAARIEATQQAISEAVQHRLDAFAQLRGYDNIVSACSYATSMHEKYGPEGRYCVSAREATWDAVFAIRDAVLAGQRQMPTGFADIEADLPQLAWPE